MFKHHFRGFLFTKALETPEGSADPGAPFELPHETEAGKPPAKAEPTETEKRLTALEKELATAKASLAETQQSERYWANKARGTPAPEPEPEPVDDEVPEPGVSPFAGEKPEKFLDDLSAEGLGAMLKRGVITQEQFDGALAKLEDRITRKVESRLQLHAQHTAMDAKFNEFPELLADSKRVAAGEQPQTELYKRTKEHFRAMVADDPSLKNSVGATLAAARLAKKELEMEAKAAAPANGSGDRQSQRRERIAAQGGERAPAGGSEEGAGNDELSATAREVIGNLSKHLTVRGKDGKVTMTAEENYLRHAGKNGR